jgi:N-acetylmuramic acid 6-phosphate etherase
LNATEKKNKASIGIDEKSSLEIAKIINADDHLVAKEISKELDVIAKAIDVAYETISSNGRLVYIGAGTSGRLGVLDASEMPPTFGVSNNVIVGLIAGGDEALRNPIEGAEDSETLIIEDLKKIKFSKNDTLMGIAASGGTPYVMAGLKYAKELGSKTIALSTNKNSKIGTIADIAIEIEVGPEIITGSTRMKSGTAQKLVINMISTGAMIK